MPNNTTDVENETRAKCAAEMAFLDQEITKLKAEIEQLKGVNNG